ncbi:MBL fold metallo-hydrolase [Chloroflexota bacterium]
MNIQVLGAHNCESQNSKLVSLLIDDTLAMDASALTSSLSLEAQQKLKAILLTHLHYDHVRDIPAIAMNLFLNSSNINIYTTPSVYDALSTHLLNDKIYPNFFERPKGNPTLKFVAIEPHKTEQIEGYGILAIPVNHSGHAFGYQVTSPESKPVFYTGMSVRAWPTAGSMYHLNYLSLKKAPNRYEQGRASHPKSSGAGTN